jgi:hypothetical protein
MTWLVASPVGTHTQPAGAATVVRFSGEVPEKVTSVCAVAVGPVLRTGTENCAVPPLRMKP